jgi:hypothetical protein
MANRGASGRVISTHSLPPLAERIAMAERHVRDGNAILQRQRNLIERRRGAGYSTDSSEELLARFETSQAIFEDDLRRFRRQQT